MSENQKNDSKGMFKEYFVPIIIGLLIMSSLVLARIPDWPFTDSKGSLLSGQVFMETGSFILDDAGQYLPGFYWQLMRNGEDVFYSYPMGTTLIHLPAIWISNYFGWDLNDVQQEAKLNRLLAALSVSILFFQIFRLSRRWNDYNTSLLLSLLLVLGTGVFSTMGMALWNLNYYVIISLFVFSILLKKQTLDKPDTGWWLGLLLFVGFIVRPSFAVIIIAVFTFLLVHDYRQLLRAVVSSAALLSLYILFSLNTFGLLIPGHYQVSDFSKLNEFFLNIAGHLISPSRGILVFSPFLLFTIYGVFKYRAGWKTSPFLKYLLVMGICQLFYLSVWFMWWGGGGFGNRLSMELWPALIIFTLIFLGPLLGESTGSMGRIGRVGFMLTGFLSIWIHVVQGANNRDTVDWFQRPNKDQFPEYFWNPRFPQILASKNQVERMSQWHWERVTSKTLRLIASHTVTDEKLKFTRWYEPERTDETYRWSEGNSVNLLIPLSPANLSPGDVYIGLDGRTYLDQVIDVSANGRYVGSITTDRNMGRFEFHFGPIPRDEIEQIDIHLHVKTPKSPIIEQPKISPDPRELGFCLFGINVYMKQDSPVIPSGDL